MDRSLANYQSVLSSSTKLFDLAVDAHEHIHRIQVTATQDDVLTLNHDFAVATGYLGDIAGQRDLTPFEVEDDATHWRRRYAGANEFIQSHHLSSDICALRFNCPLSYIVNITHLVTISLQANDADMTHMSQKRNGKNL